MEANQMCVFVFFLLCGILVFSLIAHLRPSNLLNMTTQLPTSKNEGVRTENL